MSEAEARRDDRRPRRRVRTKLALEVLTAALVLLGCGAPRPSVTVVDPPLALFGQMLAPASVKARLVTELGFASRGGTVSCAYAVLAQEGSAAYLWVRCEERSSDGAIGSGLSMPVVLELDAESPDRIAAVRRPRDGDLYAEDVKTMFPREAVRRIFADEATLAERDAALAAALAGEASGAGPGPAGSAR